jgi:hypothetical protein
MRGMGQGLRIHTSRQVEAECVCDALREYETEVEQEGGLWMVIISEPPAGPEFTLVLSALKTCLDENEIASVKVTIDGQSYVMEGMV